ncbi:MAG TPA: GFA family protein [Polyangiaceae bacterium]
MERTTYEGRCFCGAVELIAIGRPVGMGFCHCASCRSWGAAPVNAFTLWRTDSVQVVRGDVGVYHKTEQSHRQFCLSCGGHLMTAHPLVGLVDVYAATLPALAFAPALHVHYQEAVLPLRDGLPKFRDLPKDMGGSGDTLPE